MKFLSKSSRVIPSMLLMFFWPTVSLEIEFFSSGAVDCDDYSRVWANMSVTMHSLHFAVLNSLQKIKTLYLPWLLTFCHFSYLRKCGNNDRLLLCSVLQYRKKKAQRKHLSEKLSRWWGKKGNCFIMVERERWQKWQHRSEWKSLMYVKLFK